MPELARALHRAPCSGCGHSRRYIFNREAHERGFTAVATGHNLDDEAATLLGNVLRWQMDHLPRQAPTLESTHPRLVKKIKPLYTLTEKETASYCLLRRIAYHRDECPNAVGAKSLLYKETLNAVEVQSPGTKQSFVQGFQRRARSLLEDPALELRECSECGQPTTTQVCAFCRMWERARASRAATRGLAAAPRR